MTMTDHTRPLWADLPHGDEITALLDELRTLSLDEARDMITVWGDVQEAMQGAAWAAWRAASGTARTTAWVAALNAAVDLPRRDAAWVAAGEATRALVVADLVGQYGLTREHLDVLTGPARVVPRLASIIDVALAGSAPEAVTS